MHLNVEENTALDTIWIKGMMETLECWMGWYCKELTNHNLRKRQDPFASESPSLSQFMLLMAHILNLEEKPPCFSWTWKVTIFLKGGTSKGFNYPDAGDLKKENGFSNNSVRWVWGGSPTNLAFLYLPLPICRDRQEQFNKYPHFHFQFSSFFHSIKLLKHDYNLTTSIKQ